VTRVVLLATLVVLVLAANAGAADPACEVYNPQSGVLEVIGGPGCGTPTPVCRARCGPTPVCTGACLPFSGADVGRIVAIGVAFIGLGIVLRSRPD
jgi:hypothetical protein